MLALVPITLFIIVITCLITFAAWSNQKLFDGLIFWPPAIDIQHQYYRFFTCGLIHSDLIHLLFNMITLFYAGAFVETHYPGELGIPRYMYAVMYFGAIIAANAPTYQKHKTDYGYRSLGASGGVCAVLFATILMAPWNMVQVIFIPMPAILYGVLFLAYSVYMGKRGGDNVNHDAHFWGAIFGVVFTMVLRPSVISTFLNEISHPRF